MKEIIVNFVRNKTLKKMNTAQIKQRIHEYIDYADERFLRLVYSMVESEHTETPFFNVPDEEMVKRTKKSLQSIDNGNTRSIHSFKKDVETWKEKRAIQ